MSEDKNFEDKENLEIYKRRHFVYGKNKNKEPAWRCLSCGEGGKDFSDYRENLPQQGVLFGEENITPRIYRSNLITETHMLDCTGDPKLGEMREDFIDFMSTYSENTYAASWLIGLEQILLQKEGVWKILGEHLGWPVGMDGIDGWMPYEQAYAMLSENTKEN